MENKGVESFRRLSKLQDQGTESCADYILPDYLGDVRKILYTETVSGPAGKGRADGGEEFYGTLNHNVIYLDSDGKPTGASFTSDYELFVRCPADEGEIFGIPRISSSAIRLIGPRKLSAKAGISVSAYSLSEESIEVIGDAFSDGKEPETLERVIDFAQMTECQGEEREYAECIERLEGRIADEVQVLYSGANIGINEIQTIDKGVVLRGNITVYAVIEDSDSGLHLVEKSIPIEEQIPFDNVNDGMELNPTASVASLVTRVNADDTGCEVVCSIVAEYSCVASYNGKTSIVTDAYLKEANTENRYADLRYTELTEQIRVNESGACTLPREAVCQDTIREAMIISVTPRVEDVCAEDGAIVIKGELKFSGIASVVTEDGERSYSPLKFISPFETRLNSVKPISKDAVLQVNLIGITPSCVLDEDNVVVSYKLQGSVAISENKCVRRLSECKVTSECVEGRPDGRITVYYPDPDDTLFSVAKRYHTSSAKVAWDNSITSAASSDGEDKGLAGVKKLLIF